MNKEEKNIVPYDLISRYLSGEASIDDQIDFEQWKAATPKNEQIFNEYRKIWIKTGETNIYPPVDIDEEWQRFMNAAGIRKGHKTEILQRNIFIRIAAVIVLAMVLGISLYTIIDASKYDVYYAENEVKRVVLPDGSEVFLNRYSKLKYLSSFKKGREMKLKGEAFFNVVKDSLNPFIIRSGNLFVEVVGTSFSVRAYNDEDNIDIAVESGKVAVYQKSNPDEKDYLTKGEKLIYNKQDDNKLLEKNTDVNIHAWKTGILIFTDENLAVVIKKLEEIYGIKFIVLNSEILKCRISVSFDNNSLSYILNTIEKTLDLKIARRGESYTIDGSPC